MISQVKHMPWRRLAGRGLGVALLVILAFYVGQAIFSRNHSPARLVVYAFSTQE